MQDGSACKVLQGLSVEGECTEQCNLALIAKGFALFYT
jgi:hypothetical protein